MIMARNAQHDIKPRGTETKYSCASAETKKTNRLAAALDTPSCKRGLYKCLINQK